MSNFPRRSRRLIALLVLSFPAFAAHAATTGFDVYSDRGALHRLDGEKDRDGLPALAYRRSSDGGRSWTAPARVDAGRPRAYRFAAGDARVAADGGTLLAVWTATGSGPYGTGPLVAARSEDGGRTWMPAASPDGGGGPHGRRFPALTASSGTFHALWLDRRGLAWARAARTEDGGRTWTEPASVDRSTCECCWNVLAARGRRAWGLFRGLKPRDMLVASTGGGAWGRPRPVSPFGWQFNGCPHVGGGLALAEDGKTLDALVWTGREDQAGLYAVRSRDAGASWGAPVRVGGAGAKHGDLSRSGARLAAVWDEDGGVWAATSEDGTSWTAPRRLSAAGAESGAPRVAAIPGGFRAFWLEKGVAGTALRSAPIP